MARKKISVIDETSTGRNKRFRDNYSGEEMTRLKFVSKIKSGSYKNYHVRNINGMETPVSNPDKTTNNNLK